MAEKLVFSVLASISSPVVQQLLKEKNLVLGVQKQVDILATTLRSLQVFLRDADVKQVNDAGVRAWLQDLKDIAYDADDVLDEWRTTILLSQLNLNPVTPTFTEKIMYYLFSPCSSLLNPVTSTITQKMYYLFSPCSSHIPAFCSCFIPDDLPQHLRIANEIQGINESLDSIDRDRTRFQLTEIPIQHSLPRRATSSLVNVAEIHGRDDDKKTIVDWLLGASSRQEIHMPVPILSIVGTGGFGKTTLAQLLFQQEKTNFELLIWVCISQPFDREKVAKEIIEQATENKVRNFVGWQALHQQLSDSIKGKRFLIVLDDVWSKDPEDWAPFRLSLNGGAQGSRIVVTTRDEGVANMMGSIIHRLAKLSDQECWFLFQQIAFAGRSQVKCETLEEIGMQIAKKCKGVPLAAKTIASLMQLKHTKIEWRNVLESDIWKMQYEGTGFLPSLFLSYHDLPSELKQCFLYCAIFPKDKIIEKDMLVKLWMAQGFLGLDVEEELEIIGGGYFDDLAMRSFFQDFKKDDGGKITSCKMHDLVHDFAQFLTKNECSILENSDTLLNSEKLRHINAGYIDIESLSSFKVKKIRSLILGGSKPILSELFCQVTCLRTLDLSFSSLEKLPDEVERLLHLRYLDLSWTKLKELPETLCNLFNLLTLKLTWCSDLRKLPEGIGRLLNLRHLEWEDTENLKYFPQGFGKLKHLRTLHKFVVSNASGGCKLEELKNLNLISGGLNITGLRQVEYIDEAKRAELQRKANIVYLTLDFGEGSERVFTNNTEKRMETIIEDLQPHNNLEALNIQDYPGLAFPSWMSTMSNIVQLELNNCPNCTQLSALGKLPSLVTLSIFCCDLIKLVGVEFLGISESGIQRQTSFPKLRKLSFEYLNKWEEWNLPLSLFAQNEILPSLSYLRISVCFKLESLPGGINKFEGLANEESMRGRGDILTRLELEEMREWEEEDVQQTTAASIMPNLRDLTIWGCRKLKVIPLFSHNLRKLKIGCCRRLIGMPSLSNLPSLESLKFTGDVGVFSRSLTPIIIGSNSNHNLKSFKLYNSPHSSLPQGLNHFKSLQELVIHECRSIDFNPEEELSSEHFPNLRKLVISGCDLMTEERCSRVNWSKLSHISEISVNGKRMGATKSMITTDGAE